MSIILRYAQSTARRINRKFNSRSLLSISQSNFTARWSNKACVLANLRWPLWYTTFNEVFLDRAKGNLKVETKLQSPSWPCSRLTWLLHVNRKMVRAWRKTPVTMGTFRCDSDPRNAETCAFFCLSSVCPWSANDPALRQGSGLPTRLRWRDIIHQLVKM
jgi:hypothetical protein